MFLILDMAVVQTHLAKSWSKIQVFDQQTDYHWFRQRAKSRSSQKSQTNTYIINKHEEKAGS